MKNLSRRQFFEKSTMGIGAALLAGKMTAGAMIPKKVKMPLGFQIWTVREMLLKDFPGTLKMIANMGYKSVEMCSPPGYGFKPLMSMSAKEMKQVINDAGLAF